MLARFLATVAALLLACASPQAQAHVRAPERVSASFADLARAAPPETALPAKSASKPKTAPPARATLENPAPGENAALSHWHVCKNWSPLPNCTVGIADDVWGVEKASTGLQSRLGHTGYVKDQLLSDELYAQARQYRAGVGRFTSRDEWVGDNQNPITRNKYLAFIGNPGSYQDPDGRQSIRINVASCTEEGNCSLAQTSSIGLHLLNPSRMATTSQADALRESQARSVLFNGGRTDSAMVAGPLIASGAGEFESPYIAHGDSTRLSAMQSSAELDRALDVETGYVPYGLATEAAGEAAFHSIPPVAVFSGLHTMGTAKDEVEFASGAIEFVGGAVPIGFALRGEMAAMQSQRAFTAMQQGKPIVLVESGPGPIAAKLSMEPAPAISATDETSPSTTLAAGSESGWSPILSTQKEISLATRRKAAAVDRWLKSSDSRVAQTYRNNLGGNQNFAAMIRGRVIDRRMNAWFKDRFGDVPGVRIDQRIPGSASESRPDLYLPDLDGNRVIFDIGGASKINEIHKYDGMADLIFPIVH